MNTEAPTLSVATNPKVRTSISESKAQGAESDNKSRNLLRPTHGAHLRVSTHRNITTLKVNAVLPGNRATFMTRLGGIVIFHSGN